MAQEVSMQLDDLISQWKEGSQEAYHELFSMLYPCIHKLARKKLMKERYASGLQTTELVQEIFLSLREKNQLNYENRKHFLNLAGVVMHRFLVDLARKRKSQRHGGQLQQVDLDVKNLSMEVRPETIIAIDECLELLRKNDPIMETIVKLRFSAGYSIKEISEILELPERSTHRKWQFAKAWLFKQLSKEYYVPPIQKTYGTIGA